MVRCFYVGYLLKCVDFIFCNGYKNTWIVIEFFGMTHMPTANCFRSTLFLHFNQKSVGNVCFGLYVYCFSVVAAVSFRIRSVEWWDSSCEANDFKMFFFFFQLNGPKCEWNWFNVAKLDGRPLCALTPIFRSCERDTFWEFN